MQSYIQNHNDRVITALDKVLSTDGRFLARDSMLSALYAIANPSVRHTGGWVENGWS